MEKHMAEVIQSLRDTAAHLDALADIWDDEQFGGEYCQRIENDRRQARRIRDTANAIEREQRAGPFESLPDRLEGARL